MSVLKLESEEYSGPPLAGLLVGRERRVLIVSSGDTSVIADALAAGNEVITVTFPNPSGPQVSGARFDVIVVVDEQRKLDLDRVCSWLRTYLAADGFALFGSDTNEASAAASRANFASVRLPADTWFDAEPIDLLIVHGDRESPVWPAAEAETPHERAQLLAMLRDTQLALAERDAMIGLLTFLGRRGDALGNAVGHRLIAWRSTRSGHAAWATARWTRARVRAYRARRAS